MVSIISFISKYRCCEILSARKSETFNFRTGLMPTDGLSEGSTPPRGIVKSKHQPQGRANDLGQPGENKMGFPKWELA